IPFSIRILCSGTRGGEVMLIFWIVPAPCSITAAILGYSMRGVIGLLKGAGSGSCIGRGMLTGMTTGDDEGPIRPITGFVKSPGGGGIPGVGWIGAASPRPGNVATGGVAI